LKDLVIEIIKELSMRLKEKGENLSGKASLTYVNLLKNFVLERLHIESPDRRLYDYLSIDTLEFLLDWLH
jgi:hypothetical protein